MRRLGGRPQHVIIGNAGICVFPICVQFRINCFYCTEKTGRFRFGKRKYNKLTNRTGIAIVTRMIAATVFAVMVNVM